MKLPHYVQITDETPYGDSKFFRIRLNPKYKDHKGLLLHEYTHVKQWYVGLVVGLVIALVVYAVFQREDYTLYALCIAPSLKGLLYTFIKPCRLYMEIQAFQQQLTTKPVKQREHYIKAYAKIIANNYNINVSEEHVAHRLRGKL